MQRRARAPIASARRSPEAASAGRISVLRMAVSLEAAQLSSTFSSAYAAGLCIDGLLGTLCATGDAASEADGWVNYYASAPFYRRLVDWLVRLENHRVQSAYDGSHAAKLVAFEMIFYYAALLYVGLIDLLQEWVYYKKIAKVIKAAETHKATYPPPK